MKSLKNLLIPGIVLALLIVTLIIVVVVKNNSNEGEEVVDLSIVKIEANDVDSVVVDKKGQDSITLEAQGTDSEGNTTFKVSGSDGTVINAPSDSAVSRFLLVILDFKANAKVDAKDPNLADFGLQDPDYTIRIKSRSQGEKTIYVGNETVDPSLCYFKVEGDDNIYTVASAKRTFCGYELINFSGIVKVSSELQKLVNVVFERKGSSMITPLNIELTCDGTKDVPEINMVSPIKHGTSSELSRMISELSDLEISSFVHLSDEELAEKGLDDPMFHFVLTMDDGTVKEIWLGELTDGMYYGKSNFTDDYFTVAAQQLSNLETPLVNLMDPYVYYTNVKNIKHINGSFEDVEFEFDIRAENSITEDGAKVVLNGRDAKITDSKGSSYAGVFFQTISCIKIADLDDNYDPKGEPFLTLDILDNDYVNTKIEFIQRGDASYYVVINGEYTGFYVNESELTHDGGSDTFNYGVTAAYRLLVTAIDNNRNGVYDMPEE